ncbi:hypothetical protein [Chryseobacterium sp.]|uniref:hypothetical protein n=1 Tax=Chryseobacterium sp. TaxID=1871047 RepID=UPI0025B9F191|nr:hypothetical protein [Chryseobacterium sp.]
MKKIFLLAGFICFQLSFAQSILDLGLYNMELQGMKPVKVNEEMKKIGITRIPFNTEDTTLISKIAGSDIAARIKSLYMLPYEDPKDDINDGGVYIYQFNTKTDLEEYLKQNFEQSNYRVLVKDNFFIKIWSDYSRHIKGKETSEDHLDKMEKYYLNLGAERIELKPDESIIDYTVSQ